jgi:hypothetical protein
MQPSPTYILRVPTINDSSSNQSTKKKKKKKSSSIRSVVFRGSREMFSINVGISSEWVENVGE